MNGKTKTALIILQASILLGVLGDLLIRESPWGLNVFIWLVFFVFAMAAAGAHRSAYHLSLHTLSLYGALIFFGFTYLWRDSEELRVFSFLAILTVLAVLMMPALRINSKIAGTIHYFFAGAWSVINVAFAPFLLLMEDVKFKSIPKRGIVVHLVPILKGLAIALPIVLLFGTLFMAADAVYEGLIRSTFQLDLEVFWSHVLLICVLTWIVAGYLRGLTFDAFEISKDLAGSAVSKETPKPAKSVTSPDAEDPAEEKETVDGDAGAKPKSWNLQEIENSLLPEGFTLGSVETGIILGAVNLLFLSFVIVQIPYLFGGMDLIQSTPDFKLSEYARRGFGELIAVASMVLPMLLAFHWLLKKGNLFAEKLFKILASVQIGLLFIIMASAAQRLMLLTGNLGYGLTADRLYSIIFIILLGMIFIWFTITVLFGARKHFAWGALWCGLFIMATSNVLNPDDFIVRTNVRLMQEGREFDAGYNGGLSADAVPALRQSLDLMTSGDREKVLKKMHRQLCELRQNDDIRTWNFSRNSAEGVLENVSEISKRGCPDSSYIND